MGQHRPQRRPNPVQSGVSLFSLRDLGALRGSKGFGLRHLWLRNVLSSWQALFETTYSTNHTNRGTLLCFHSWHSCHSWFKRVCVEAFAVNGQLSGVGYRLAVRNPGLPMLRFGALIHGSLEVVSDSGFRASDFQPARAGVVPRKALQANDL
jgi:hypothetical protein